MRITTMLGDALGRGISFLPNIIAAVVILAVGLFIAKALGRLTERSLQAVGLHRRSSAQKLLGEGRSLERVPSAGGRIVYWVLGLVTIGLAVDALHLAWLSAGVARVLGYLPNVLAAGAIVLCGYVAGNFVAGQFARREAGATLLPRLARGGIFALAAFMALQQLGIASSIVTIAFTAAIGAMAVAGALAFGLGNRELAGRVTSEWYARRGSGLRRMDASSMRATTLDEHRGLGVGGELGGPTEHSHH